jgi:polyhydroxyalkanoate synthesis regulator phasin
MGRQKTLWINEACWIKLEQMEGDSISAKVRKCIDEHDVADGARVDALRLQIARLEAYISDLEKRPKQRRTME